MVVAVLAGARFLALTGNDDVTVQLHGPPVVHAEGYERRAIYHSPQVPGYTAWAGAWIMPDKSLMTALIQATGPVSPDERRLAPASILRKMNVASRDPKMDFWGLDLSVKYLRSTDRGATWGSFRTDAFEALGPHAYTPQATTALRDGTIVRRVNGYDLRYDDSVPHTAYLQRLPPGATTWSEPQVVLDPAKYTYQFSRLQQLRDGRLIATGNVWEAPAGSPPSTLAKAPGRFLLMVSTDSGGTWRNGMTIPSNVSVPANEWDTAELPNGDLLAVFRTEDPADPSAQVRRQGLLEKRGTRWVLTDVKDAPFPHSGHPELLATREGPVLHIATSGVHYTSDAGVTWKRLSFSPRALYESGYYPHALQTDDGTVYVFSHVGWDNGYGEVDQSILMDKFRLVEGNAPANGSR